MSELYVFVEGGDDKKLLKKVFEKCHKDYTISIFKFASAENKLIRNLIGRLQEANVYHILITDKDTFPSKTMRKKKLSKIYGININNIIVVEKSIESWYAAGAKRNMTIFSKNHSTTIDKLEFDRLIGGQHKHSEIMNEISTDFDTNKAIQQNNSFKYFYQELKTILNKI